MPAKTLRLAAALAAAAIFAPTAEAHPRLKHADPSPGAVLKSAPTAIHMTFSEGLVPRFTGLTLSDARGVSVPTGAPGFSGDDNTELTVAIPSRLAPGTYNVRWHAVSVDTHRVTGSYSFKIKS